MNLFEKELYHAKTNNVELIRELNALWNSLSDELRTRKNIKWNHRLSVLNMKEGLYDLLTCSGAKTKNTSAWFISQKCMLCHKKDRKLKARLLSSVLDSPFYDRYFMNDLADCVRNWSISEISLDDFTRLEYDENFVKSIVLDFFDSLKDKELSKHAHFFATEYKAGYAVPHLKQNENVYFKFYPDYFRGYSLYLIQKTNTLLDYFFTNHQIMECSTTGMHVKDPFTNHVGLDSVPANVMDYLFIDYLTNRFSENESQLKEIEKLKAWKNSRVTEQADLFLEMQKKIEEASAKEEVPYETIYEKICASNQVFLSILSEVLGYGIYNVWKKDSKKGLELMKAYIYADFPLEEKPDFSFLGLSDEKLIESALLFRNYGWKPEFMRTRVKKDDLSY